MVSKLFLDVIVASKLFLKDPHLFGIYNEMCKNETL